MQVLSAAGALVARSHEFMPAAPLTAMLPLGAPLTTPLASGRRLRVAPLVGLVVREIARRAAPVVGRAITRAVQRLRDRYNGPDPRRNMENRLEDAKRALDIVDLLDQALAGSPIEAPVGEVQERVDGLIEEGFEATETGAGTFELTRVRLELAPRPVCSLATSSSPGCASSSHRSTDIVWQPVSSGK